MVERWSSRGQVAGRYCARNLLVWGDSTLMDVSILAIRATVRRITHCTSNSLLCPLVELLAPVASQLHIKVHRNCPTLVNRALYHNSDHHHNSTNLSTSTSTVPRHWVIKVTHRVIRLLPGAKDPIDIKPLVLGPVLVERARVEVKVGVKLLARHM